MARAQRCHNNMIVTVNESGDCSTALEVNQPCAAIMLWDSRSNPDSSDSISVNRDRRSHRIVPIHRGDLAVVKDGLATALGMRGYDRPKTGQCNCKRNERPGR